MDPSTLTVAVLTHPLGEFSMIVAISEALKRTVFWYDNEWRNRLAWVLSAVVGVAYGTLCANLTHSDPAAGGVVGLGMALAASGFYRVGIGQAVGVARKALGRKRSAPPPTLEA